MHDLSDFVAPVSEALTLLREQAQLVVRLISSNSGFVFYSDGVSAVDDMSARKAICDCLLQWKYEANGTQLSVPEFAGGRSNNTCVYAAAINAEIVQEVLKLNALKLQWSKFHSDLRKLFGGGLESSSVFPKLEREMEATKKMRALLALCGWGDIDLDASDRLVPLLDGPALSINWFRTYTAPSKQSTLGRVIIELNRMAETSVGNTLEYALAEIARLEMMQHETPIAYRSKAHREHIHYRAIVEKNGVRLPAIQGYAMNPVLFPEGNMEPELTVFETKRREGGGRKTSISTDLVSFMVPYFYWYTDQAEREVTSLKTVKSQNPHAKTRYPGIWLASRARRKGRVAFVMIKQKSGATSSFNIHKLGIVHAWRKGAIVYSDERSIKLDDVLAAQPSDDQVASMLAWHDDVD